MDAGGGESRGFAFEIAEEESTESAGANDLPGAKCSNGGQDIFGGGIAEQIAADAAADTLEKFEVVAAHAEQQDLDVGNESSNFADDLEIVGEGALRREKKNVGRILKKRFRRERDRDLRARDFDVVDFAKHARQCFTEESVFCGDKDAGFLRNGLTRREWQLFDEVIARTIHWDLQALSGCCLHGGTPLLQLDLTTRRATGLELPEPGRGKEMHFEDRGKLDEGRKNGS